MNTSLSPHGESGLKSPMFAGPLWVSPVSLHTERVDWNFPAAVDFMIRRVSLHTERVDWNWPFAWKRPNGCHVSLHTERVDWNRLQFRRLPRSRWSLSTRREWIEIGHLPESVRTAVSLSTRREWIEIFRCCQDGETCESLSTRREWIEIGASTVLVWCLSVSLHTERVDWNIKSEGSAKVAGFGLSPHGESGLKSICVTI